MASKLSLRTAAILIGMGGGLHAQTGLVAHWTFNETMGTTAQDSHGGFHGTLTGGAAFVAGGISGNAVSLDGVTNSLVNMGTSIPGFTTGDFSLVAWIKTTTTVGSPFVGKHESGSLNGYFLGVNAGSGYGQTNKAWFYNGTNPGGEAISTTTVNNGSWHQLIGVRTAGGDIRLYIDGVLEDTVPSQGMFANSAPFLVGGANVSGTPTGSFTGLVDDVQIYNVALSSSEVQLLFSNPGQTTAIPEPSVSGLWLATGIGGFAVVRVWRQRKRA